MKFIYLILLLLSPNLVYADYRGVWSDSQGNYFSIQEKNGMVLFLDLSRSLNPAKQLSEHGIEQKIEYLAHYGEAYIMIDGKINYKMFCIPPLLFLPNLYPELKGRISPFLLTFHLHSENQASIHNTCDFCSGSTIDVNLNKVF